MSTSGSNGILLGDPVPWFRAREISGRRADLHVSAGRWILLAFLDSLDEPPAQTHAQTHSEKRLATLIDLATVCSDDHLVIYAILATPPDDHAALIALSGPVLKFIADYDGVIGAYFNAHRSPRTVVLDPMLRVVANIPSSPAQQHDSTLESFLRQLPSVDNSAGVPLSAPVLIVPRVLDFPLCEHLVGLFDKIGGTDSGFLVEQDGKPATIVDHAKKSRQDLLIVAPALRQIIRDRIVRRLLPSVELYFQFKATHLDRYIVACYDSARGGCFFRHRDNMNPGVEHRRFAVSLNLNGNYDGCDLIFPEFGRRTYRAPAGGAIVFSCGALHEVTPITKGRRYAFLPFLYGESDVKKSVENNALLHEIGVDYQVGQHNLYAAQPSAAEQRESRV